MLLFFYFFLAWFWTKTSSRSSWESWGNLVKTLKFLQFLCFWCLGYDENIMSLGRCWVLYQQISTGFAIPKTWDYNNHFEFLIVLWCWNFRNCKFALPYCHLDSYCNLKFSELQNRWKSADIVLSNVLGTWYFHRTQGTKNIRIGKFWRFWQNFLNFF